MKLNFFKESFRKKGMGQVYTVSLGLIALCIVFGAINPTFFSGRNVANLLRQVTTILLIAIGQAYVLITGNIDLSIGSVVGMSGMIAATLMTKGVNPWVAALIAMVCSIIFGTINGLLVAKCKLPPFIATLGTMSICRGIAQIVNGNYNTDSIGEAAETFRNVFYYGKTLGIYTIIFIAAAVWLVFNYVLSRTKTGRYIYAVGSNSNAARLSGVSIVGTTVCAYVISSFCSGLVGLVTCAISGMGMMDAGISYEMYGVAAAVIGGISTMGGQGILLGTVIGSGVWCVLQNGLQFAGAPVAVRNIVIGVIVIVSVLIDVIVRQGDKSKSSK